jgi:hypothetical protein
VSEPRVRVVRAVRTNGSCTTWAWTGAAPGRARSKTKRAGRRRRTRRRRRAGPPAASPSAVVSPRCPVVDFVASLPSRRKGQQGPPLRRSFYTCSNPEHVPPRCPVVDFVASPPSRRKGQQDPPLHRSFYTCTDLSSTGRPCRVPTRGRRDWPLSGTTGRREDPGPTGGRRRASHAAPRNGPQRYSTANCSPRRV